MADINIEGLNHAAYRCRNSEDTRQFYEDFLGLPLVDALAIGTTATGRKANVLHTFFAMADGSCIAFFEAPDEPFEFKTQQDFDLHIALTVDQDTLHTMFEKGKAEGIETRGISDHVAVGIAKVDRVDELVVGDSARVDSRLLSLL